MVFWVIQGRGIEHWFSEWQDDEAQFEEIVCDLAPSAGEKLSFKAAEP